MIFLIFITANAEQNNFSINKNYCDAISDFGQTPVLISNYKLGLIDKILSVAKGILLSGGGDIHPKFFNQQVHPKSNNINIARDEFELELFHKAVQKDIPVLGICRGIQIINIAQNGNLFQDIKNHMQKLPRDLPSHTVRLSKQNNFLSFDKIDTIEVNSMHHQAINILGQKLIATAISNDGLIEAIEYPNKKFIVGVQWHPECLYKTYKVHREIFKKFVAATMI